MHRTLTPSMPGETYDRWRLVRSITVGIIGTAGVASLFGLALSLCNDFYGVRAKIDQEHFSGYRTASTEQAR